MIKHINIYAAKHRNAKQIDECERESLRPGVVAEGKVRFSALGWVPEQEGS